MQTVPGYESDKFRIALYELSSGIIKVISDAFDNWVTDIIWAPDSKSIYFTGEVQSVNPLFRIDINTLKIEEIISKKYVGGFTLSPDGKTVFLQLQTKSPPR
jgi:tricorn protease-like protein